MRPALRGFGEAPESLSGRRSATKSCTDPQRTRHAKSVEQASR